ncbi:MAG TPA: 2-phosphosulfolactate phosphatase [Desulfosporosinus sp.]|nr:2-phosphosulfolactate phosphatase [Desulfosporosinus sp.]
MQVDVLPNAGSPLLPYLEDKLVIVIDVLRATSTMVTALANGCQSIIPVLSPEDAMERRLTLPGSLLGGERHILPIEGFDLGNSPFDYVPEKVGGKKVIITTRNGTRAIRDASAAPKIWMAAFLNMQSVILAVLRQFEQSDKLQGVVVFCAGTEERFDLSDTLCAGMLIDGLGTNVTLNDLGEASRMLYRSSGNFLLHKISDSAHGKKLIAAGFERDVVYCSTPNILPIIPVYQEGEIVWLTEE